MQVDRLSKRMREYFLISVLLMLAHKIECYYTAEWLESPFFQLLIGSGHWAGASPEEMVGEAIFLTFCFWLFTGLGMGMLVLQGGRWILFALGVWGLTYLLEWHHIVRAVSRGGYYTGVVSAVFYLGFGGFYWRELLGHVHRQPAPAPVSVRAPEEVG